MDTLQNELQDTYPLLRIQLLGVNERGQEAGNAGTVAGRDLPWLQDVDADENGIGDVTGDRWAVNNRDVVILDGTNAKVGVFNLNPPNGLAEAANYNTLREMLIDAAMQSQKPWMNSTNRLDVDNDGRVVPLDVLLIINVLNSAGPHQLPVPTAAQPVQRYYDVNGDGLIAPLDALNVINFLNTPVSAGGEGESPSAIGEYREPAVPAWAAAKTASSLAGAGADRPLAGNSFVSASQTDHSTADAARLLAVDRLFAGAVGRRSIPDRSASAEVDDWSAVPVEPRVALKLLNGG